METNILYSLLQIFFLIRMNNTPQGDGNSHLTLQLKSIRFAKNKNK